MEMGREYKKLTIEMLNEIAPEKYIVYGNDAFNEAIQDEIFRMYHFSDVYRKLLRVAHRTNTYMCPEWDYEKFPQKIWRSNGIYNYSPRN